MEAKVKTIDLVCFLAAHYHVFILVKPADNVSLEIAAIFLEKSRIYYSEIVAERPQPVKGKLAVASFSHIQLLLKQLVAL